MRAKTFAWCSAIVLLVALLIAIPAFAQSAKDQVIAFDATPNATLTYPVSINSRGEVTGYFVDANGLHGFLREPRGQVITFDAPEAIQNAIDGTHPSGINDWGEITGWFQSMSGTHGFLRDRDGTISTFQVSNHPTTPSAINTKGEISGWYLDATGAHGFLRHKHGAITTFDVAVKGVNGTFPVSINNDGQIAGYYYLDRAYSFVRDENGEIKTFEAPGAGTTGNTTGGTFVMGINARGEMAGYLRSSTTLRSFLRTRNGRIVSFDANPNSSIIGTLATGINSEGAITGWCYDDTGNNILGFVRSPRGAIITFGTGFVGIDPLAINAIGEITGFYYDSNNKIRGFVRKADPYQWIRNEFPDHDEDRDHRD